MRPFCLRLARHVLLVTLFGGLSLACGGGSDTAGGPDGARDAPVTDGGNANDAPETGAPTDAATDGTDRTDGNGADAPPPWTTQCGQGPPIIPDAPDVGSFCDVYTDVLCASTEACSPSDFRRQYAGSQTTCRAITRTRCVTDVLPSLHAGGASATAEADVRACLRARGRQSCADVSSGCPVQGCARLLGTFGVGAPCFNPFECQSGLCQKDDAFGFLDPIGCGVCAATLGAGAACTTFPASNACGPGFRCYNAAPGLSLPGTCTRERGPGEACNEVDAPCYGGQLCVQGKCALPATEGQACTEVDEVVLSRPPCDFSRDLDCVNGTCQRFPAQQPGDACDLIHPVTNACSGGTCRGMFDGNSYPGHCIAWLQEGELCRGVGCPATHRCEGNECITGFCSPDTNRCAYAEPMLCLGAEGTQATIDATGGSLASQSGQTVLEVPPGALAQARVLTLIPIPAPGPGSLGQTFDLGPSGTTFTRFARVSLSYDAAALGTDDPARLKLGFWNGSAWEPLPFSVVDPATQTVHGFTRHLTPFSIILVRETRCCHACVRDVCLGIDGQQSHELCGCTVASLSQAQIDMARDQLDQCHAADQAGSFDCGCYADNAWIGECAVSTQPDTCCPGGLLCAIGRRAADDYGCCQAKGANQVCPAGTVSTEIYAQGPLFCIRRGDNNSLLPAMGARCMPPMDLDRGDGGAGSN